MIALTAMNMKYLICRLKEMMLIPCQPPSIPKIKIKYRNKNDAVIKYY